MCLEWEEGMEEVMNKKLALSAPRILQLKLKFEVFEWIYPVILGGSFSTRHPTALSQSSISIIEGTISCHYLGAMTIEKGWL